MNQSKANFDIREVTKVTSSYLSEMKAVFGALFPDLTPAFEEILTHRLDAEGRIQNQIFVGLCGESVAGILQIFYYPWKGGLVSVADLVGVLESIRGSGLGLGMIRHTSIATKKVASQWHVSPKGLLGLTELDQGDSNSWVVRRVKLFERMGAQVRRDLVYQYDGLPESSGDIILWYPMSDGVVEISTKELAWVLWQSGGLPSEEFVRRYGKINDVE